MSLRDFMATTTQYSIDALALAAGAAVAGILIRVGISSKKFMQSYRSKNDFEGQVKAATKISDQLAVLRVSLEADRAYVFQFSNGTFYQNRMSQLNTVCTHESTGDGVSSIGPNKTELLVSQMPKFFSQITQSACLIRRTEDLEDCMMRARLEEQATGIFIIAPFFSHKGVIEGFLGVDYLRSRECVKNYTGEKTEKCKEACDTVEHAANRIGSILRSVT